MNLVGRRRGRHALAAHLRWHGYLKNEGECTLYIGTRAPFGYGMFKPGGGRNATPSHRYAWELAVGKIPPGMHVLHRCRNRNCVAIGHLYLGTPKDNAADAIREGTFNPFRRNRPHCAHGHEYTPENTRWRTRANKRWRVCLACAKEAGRKRWAERGTA